MVFRNTSFACPGCREALAAEASIAWCNRCKGVWVTEAELEERVRIVRGMNELNLEIVFGPSYSSSAHLVRPCPLCHQPLGHATLGKIEVDRCDQKHGIWFDAGELERVLRASALLGEAVDVPVVNLTPEERAMRAESPERSGSFGASDAIEAVLWVVTAIAALFA